MNFSADRAAEFTHGEITGMLLLRGGEQEELLTRAHAVRVVDAGEKIYLRGLIEYSNRCRKNCLYCGIRRDKAVGRYTLSEEETVEAARTAVRKGYGSVVIQAGEITSARHIAAIERIVRRIKALTPQAAGLTGEESAGWDSSPGITLSLGEQSAATYRRWFEAGATRYLLRIETSDRELFARIHPADGRHRYDNRLRALRDLREAGYQVGTGVMTGLPGQTVGHLAGDLLFMRGIGIDMCGMGPYIECTGTPLAGLHTPSLVERENLTLNMIAVLRLMMPDINIAATTALETISSGARMRALRGGANVMMPNVTPAESAHGYLLYDNKPQPGSFTADGNIFGLGMKGDSPRFSKKRRP